MQIQRTLLHFTCLALNLIFYSFNLLLLDLIFSNSEPVPAFPAVTILFLSFFILASFSTILRPMQSLGDSMIPFLLLSGRAFLSSRTDAFGTIYIGGGMAMVIVAVAILFGNHCGQNVLREQAERKQKQAKAIYFWSAHFRRFYPIDVMAQITGLVVAFDMHFIVAIFLFAGESATLGNVIVSSLFLFALPSYVVAHLAKQANALNSVIFGILHFASYLTITLLIFPLLVGELSKVYPDWNSIVFIQAPMFCIPAILVAIVYKVQMSFTDVF